ncbi:hypothetical protein GFB49_04440 [Epibacterium sp. SM1979]|uniref:Uncharacterized protein n=1 Tax=Tritonibacter litoralis TaxID=2662264 RepID=A0A843YFW1_9RHOB|nr:hypothetical protein [Tritonibacter litoralis]MQQ07697.1 hypothetical protein [Tritonibacter litoralis]
MPTPKLARLKKGDSVLVDYDPNTGKISEFSGEKCRVKLYGNKGVQVRRKQCLLKIGQRSGRETFKRSYMIGKITKTSLIPQSRNNRSGHFYVLEWFKESPNKTSGSHLVSDGGGELYAIVLDGVLVFRPHENPEATRLFPETAGVPNTNSLCSLRI